MAVRGAVRERGDWQADPSSPGSHGVLCYCTFSEKLVKCNPHLPK